MHHGGVGHEGQGCQHQSIGAPAHGIACVEKRRLRCVLPNYRARESAHVETLRCWSEIRLALVMLYGKFVWRCCILTIFASSKRGPRASRARRVEGVQFRFVSSLCARQWLESREIAIYVFVPPPLFSHSMLSKGFLVKSEFRPRHSLCFFHSGTFLVVVGRPMMHACVFVVGSKNPYLLENPYYFIPDTTCIAHLRHGEGRGLTGVQSSGRDRPRTALKRAPCGDTLWV